MWHSAAVLAEALKLLSHWAFARVVSNLEVGHGWDQRTEKNEVVQVMEKSGSFDWHLIVPTHICLCVGRCIYGIILRLLY